MDQTQLQQKIAEYYAKLPNQTQVAFASMKWMDTLQSISTKYTLSKEQVQTLGTETTLVLLGIVPIGEYLENIRKEIVLPEDSITRMMDEIEGSILKDLRPQLKQAYEANLKNIQIENEEAGIKTNPQFVTLPKELQDAIAKSDYQKKLYAISTKYKLQIENMGKLEEVTVKFIKGSISPSQYENTLALELGIEASKAHDIATEVNAQILVAIRENMKSQAKIENIASVSKEDIVPIPPYATKPTIKKIEPVLQPAPQVKPEVVKEVVVPKPITIPVIPQEPILVTNSAINMMKEKLEGTTSTKETISDHTLPKVGMSAAIHDPYHEPIE